MSTASSTEQIKPKRVMVSQSEFPNMPLTAAIRISHALWENFAGKSAAPHDVALALDMSPTSGTWRNLCGASIAYGLTEGGCNAAEITLSPVGRRIVAPTVEGDDSEAKVEAVLKPRISKEFFTKYHTAKFPKDEIAKNVLVGMGLPKERAGKALEILKENGKHAGLIRDTKTGPLVVVGSSPIKSVLPVIDGSDSEIEPNGSAALAAAPTGALATPSLLPRKDNRVFITHGKNKKILDQVKDIVRYGKFDPVVAAEHETVSKPVPKKVLGDMRGCQAAIIHVGSEGILYDKDHNPIPQINGNVLIEIGAAMALYGDNSF